MARLSSTLLSIVVVLTISAPILAYSGGSGTEADPYQIATPADLITLGNTPTDYDKSFILIVDIDLSGKTYSNSLIAMDTDLTISGFNGPAFTGIFDGGGHMIKNLTIQSSQPAYLGMFGIISGKSQILNLYLENIHIAATSALYTQSVGSMCGWNDSGVIKNCHVTGNMIGPRIVGGLCGNNYGTITDCSVNCIVMGGSSVGGLCGTNGNGNKLGMSILNCYTIGYISGEYDVGGLCGLNYGVVSKSHATVDVTGNTFVGGLIGENFGPISSCYTLANVYGNKAGGLCSQNKKTITNCYSDGRVFGLQIGGLCERNAPSCTITNSYARNYVVGSGAGGLCSVNSGAIYNSFWDLQASQLSFSDGGVGKTTAQMKDINTYLDAEWDFVGEDQNGTSDIWAIPKGGYPVLSWQNTPPVVEAGNKIVLGFPPNSEQLHATVSDDGLPTDQLQLFWTAQNNSGSVAFDPSASVLDPVVTFSETGVYTLRLTANDGEFQSFDEVTVTVGPDIADLNKDGIVDIQDFAILSEHWLQGQ